VIVIIAHIVLVSM